MAPPAEEEFDLGDVLKEDAEEDGSREAAANTDPEPDAAALEDDLVLVLDQFLLKKSFMLNAENANILIFC